MLALLVGACAPMEQVPLVYSSKVLGGAHVEAGTPENPGLSVNLGFKTLDAAYVPVAVAKWCQSGTSCENDIYKPMPVAGTSDEDTNSPLQVELKGVNERIAKLEQQKSEAVAQLNRLNDLEKESRERKSRIEALTKSVQDLAAAASLSGEDTEKLATARLELKAAEDFEAPETIKARAAAVSATITGLTSSIAEATTRQNELRAMVASSRLDKKSDAYSVYGSFEGNTGGNSGGATLALGKVFSTGVAAQNLTQGIREAARDASRADCLRAAGKAADAAAAAGDTTLAAKLRQGMTTCLN
jgi:predicted  nucleic acid-binding Zn-ribbon protein